MGQTLRSRLCPAALLSLDYGIPAKAWESLSSLCWLWPRHATGSRVKRRGRRVQREKSTTHEFEPGVSVSRLFQARPTGQATHAATLLIRISLPVCFFCTKDLAGRSAAKVTATYRLSRAKGSSGKPLLDHTPRTGIRPKSNLCSKRAWARSWKVEWSTPSGKSRVKTCFETKDEAMMAFSCCEMYPIWILEAAGPDRSVDLPCIPRPHGVEVLEGRELLATFTVTNLNNAGAGSLRQAIIDSNEQPGADTIDFDVAGTIRVGRTSLPAITDTVTIDGSTAPSFAGSPVVTVDFQGSKGLRFANGCRRVDPRVALAGEGRQRGRHAQRLARHGPGQLHRPSFQRKNRRRQPRRRRADQCLVARRPDRAERSGDEHQLLQRRVP